MKLTLIISLLISYNTLVQRELTQEQVLKILPERIKGFNMAEPFRSKQMQMGTLSYTLYEKKFKRRDKAFQILLFDYGKAEIMYRQAIQSSTNHAYVQSDSVVIQPFEWSGASGLESYQSKSGQSKISLGINERFYLNASGNITLQELENVVKLIDFQKLPKKVKPQSEP